MGQPAQTKAPAVAGRPPNQSMIRQTNSQTRGNPAQPGWQGMVNSMQGVQAPGTDYEMGVLGGQYLDVANNPYMQNIASSMQQQNSEALGRAQGQQAATTAGAGATMGMTGINMANRGILADQYGQNFDNALAGMYGQAYGDERNRMNQTSSNLSDRTQGLYGVGASGYGSDQQRAAQEYSAAASARASKYNSDQGLLASQWANQLGYDQLALQAMLGYEDRMANQYDMNYGIPGQQSNAYGNYMDPWGQTTQTTTGAEGDALSNIVGGGISGGLGGGLIQTGLQNSRSRPGSTASVPGPNNSGTNPYGMQ
jgi:hypothetical protein